MEKVILLRYGEIHLKGLNRGFFEKFLIENIKKAISFSGATIKKIAGRYVVCDFNEENQEQIIEKLQKVFGLHSLSVALKLKTDIDEIKKFCAELVLNNGTFKVVVRRADKRFPIKSMEFAKELGGLILDNNPNLKVDVHTPEVEVKVDIREDGWTYISFQDIMCFGGMPVGTAGKGMLLLSGGIDSPVASFYMAKRGMIINAVHFYSFPYTSLQAKEKVIRLAKKMSEFCGHINLHFISFTKVQEEINRLCDNNYMIILMRRIMMRIAQKLSRKVGANAIITGENLGQVASQTIESITATNAVVSMPVFRPLIGFDKVEIIEVAKKIGTYDISIEPFEDCCTVFLPKKPVTRPKIEDVLEQEKKLDIEKLISQCLESCELIKI